MNLVTSSEASRVTLARRGWHVEHARGVVDADLLILALPVDAIKCFVRASPELQRSPLGNAVETLAPAPPFAVWRLWLDRAPAGTRPSFAATTGLPMLDSVSLFDRLEDESRQWARTNGGSVVELHAYAVNPNDDATEVRERLWRDLHEVYPELRSAAIVEDRFLLRRDCPAFAPGSHACRPGVATSFADVAICGDFVKLPFPSALMERAASSGILAANTVLASVGVRSEPIKTVARRGLLHLPAIGRMMQG